MPQPKHILYADDDEDDHLFFKEAFNSLQRADYKLSFVSDGAEVLEFLQHKGKFADALPVDLLILDLNMPLLDGYGILKELISNPRIKNVPTYILSVSDKMEDEKRCKELGCAGFFTKPVNFKMLKTVIEKILSTYSAGAGSKS
jgi:CheY-like chemotaxis protein